MEPTYAARVRIATWQEMLAGRPEKQNTNIIVLGDNGVLYGHELVRDIGGSQDAGSIVYLHTAEKRSMLRPWERMSGPYSTRARTLCMLKKRLNHVKKVIASPDTIVQLVSH
jgi:hypothetical protein